jgi:nucleoside-diphosphate-sugar epimerase
MIYGVGGLFNRKSIQIPTYVRATLDYGRAVVIGDGKGALDHVHVEDLAELYGIAVTEVLERGGRDLPTGMEGIIFSGNGRHTWMEVAQGVADACHEAEKVTDRQVESVSLAEGVKIMASYLDGADEHMVELGLCSNSRSVPSVARRLGWKPERGSEAWQGGFRDDVEAVLKTR